MEVSYLLKSELQYELMVRGKAYQFNVAELRKKVRKVYQKEVLGLRSYARFVPDVGLEIEECECILGQLENENMAEVDHRRVSAVFYHVLRRLEYLLAHDPESEKIKGLLKRLDGIRVWLADSSAVCAKIPRVSITPNPDLKLLIEKPATFDDLTIEEEGGGKASLADEREDADSLRVDEVRAAVSTASEERMTSTPIASRPRVSFGLTTWHPATASASGVPPYGSQSYVRPSQTSNPLHTGMGPTSRFDVHRDEESDGAQFRVFQDTIDALQRQLATLQAYQSRSGATFNSSSQVKADQVYKWNIKFSGAKGESVFSFLENVEDRATSRQVDHATLLRSAGDLFTGSALVWYRSGMERRTFATWTDLATQLKQTFLPQDWEEMLLDEIRRRRQGPDEGIEIYVACVSRMFSRLSSPPSLLQRLKVMWKNLQPYYLDRIELCRLLSIEDLVERGRLVEYSRQISEARKSPDAQPTLIDPDLAYKGKRKAETKVAVIDSEETSPPPVSPKVQTPSGSGSKRKCWNCQQVTDHMAMNCPEPKTKYCYKCGHRNVTTRDCPKCKPNAKNE
jgi:hypothetical protein